VKKTRASGETCCEGEPAPRPATGQRDDAAANAEIALICKALAHPARVQVLRHLLKAGTCVFGSLAEVVPLAPSTVAQHLGQLKSAGLIEQWDAGQHSCYCISRERIETLRNLLSAL
jgi:ArsR family transcriptional regulator, arsenate/arsenite/antimonite-responsive transcriptional repressor